MAVKFVSRDDIRKARRANLYRYVLHHYDDVIRTQNGLQISMYDYPLWIGRNHSGYTYYEGMDTQTGNGIDFLMQFEEMTLPEAVTALLPYTDDWQGLERFG